MKVKITFKDPDGAIDGVRDAVQESLPDGLDDDEYEKLLESRTEDTFDKLKQWLLWKEYLTVEFDTEAGTAVVVKA